jgi:isocitrate dehydrogenase
MVIFRENSEDIYAGIEFEHGTDDLQESSRSSSRASSPSGSRRSASPRPPASASSRSARRAPRIVKAAIQYAIDNDKPSVTLVHKGNIMKFTEGAFRDWGYEVSPTTSAPPPRRRPWHVHLKNPKTGKRSSSRT